MLSIHVLILAAVAAVAPLQQPVEKLAPLEFERVVKLFKEMTEVQPLLLHERCVVFGLGESYKPDDHVESVIVVTEDPPRLAVSFLISGGYGMNFVSEFFEAPFFTKTESEQFYGMLYGKKGQTLATFPRFTLEFTSVHTLEWHFISMSFGPPQPRQPLP